MPRLTKFHQQIYRFAVVPTGADMVKSDAQFVQMLRLLTNIQQINLNTARIFLKMIAKSRIFGIRKEIGKFV